MNKVYITNLQDKLCVDRQLRSLVRRAVSTTLKYEKFPCEAEISVTFVDDEKIWEMNREYRNIDRPTDVLSFPLYELEEIDSMYNEEIVSEDDEEERTALGDIVISLERAKKQSEEYGHSFERETAFLCVHSVLHLLGYDHELGEEEEKEMFGKQDEVLKKMKLER